MDRIREELEHSRNRNLRKKKKKKIKKQPQLSSLLFSKVPRA
jgi:hypothetical protein